LFVWSAHPFLAIVCALWVRNVEAEHAEHIEHIKAEHDGHLPDIPQYEYMNRRLKPYPWGMNSLFFNPHVSGSTVFVFISTYHM
jgi:cytochrome c oxidase subunit 6a